MRRTWSWYVNSDRQVPTELETLTEMTERPKDDYLSKLVKLFPVEVATFFMAADQFARAAPAEIRLMLLWAVLVVGVVGVPVAFAKMRKLDLKLRSTQEQVVIGIIGFTSWVYSQGVLSAELGIYQASVAGVVAAILLFSYAMYNPAPTPDPTA